MSAGPNPYSPGAGMSPNPALDQEIQNKATTALIAALLGFFCCPLIHIYAIMTANEALARIQQTGAGQQHQTLATIAKYVAIIHGCLCIAVLLLYIVIIALGIGAAAVGGN